MKPLFATDLDDEERDRLGHLIEIGHGLLHADESVIAWNRAITREQEAKAEAIAAHPSGKGKR